MSMSWFVTITAGLLVLIGVVGMVAAVASKAAARRSRLFRAGSFALTAAGLVLMGASLTGWAGSNELFGGLMLTLFGSGASLAPQKKPDAPASDGTAG
jgi:hypothetical protein